MPASGVTVAFSDGVKAPFGTSAAISLAGGASQRVSVVWKGVRKGTEDVIATIDPLDTIKESREDNNKVKASVVIP